MGILTTQDSGRAFSTYVALFGIALLVTAAMYLKALNNWEYWHACVENMETYHDSRYNILCSNLNTWKTAAIIGIIIGVVDVLLVPFLLCCSVCLVCGCTALLCACVDLESPDSDTETKTEDQTTTTSATDTVDGSPATTDPQPTTNTTANSTNKETDDALSKFNLKNLPKPIIIILNILGWTVWVFLPFIGTLLITIWLYKTDAVRTNDDKLYRSALIFFVCALLNLMVFFQKFVDSVCKFVSKKILGTKVKKDEERKKFVASQV